LSLGTALLLLRLLLLLLLPFDMLLRLLVV
jgi:hypothetical protein